VGSNGGGATTEVGDLGEQIGEFGRENSVDKFGFKFHSDIFSLILEVAGEGVEGDCANTTQFSLGWSFEEKEN
jgi:hypothetical protein